MATDRIKQLEDFYRSDPADPFNGYALALEYLRSDPERSASLFEELLGDHPTYLPTYYHAAQLWAARGERGKAVTTFEHGIALAKRCGDQKTLRELQSAYDELMFE